MYVSYTHSVSLWFFAGKSTLNRLASCFLVVDVQRQICKARTPQHVGDNDNHAVAEASRNIQFASCLQKQVRLCDSKMDLAALGWDLKKVDTGAECIFCDKKLLSLGSIISVKKGIKGGAPVAAEDGTVYNRLVLIP